MHMKKIFFYFLAFSALLFSCKKKKSDSAYNHADIAFSKLKVIIRDNTGNDTAEYGIYGDADFLPHASKPVGGVLINGEPFRGPDPDVNHSSSAQYQWGGFNATESYVNNYQVVKLNIVSPNNITDMEYSMNTIPFYNGAVPYQISCSSGFSLSIDATTLPGADSLRIYISANAHSVDTSFAIISGTFVISPTLLSALNISDNNDPGTMFISAWKNYNFSLKDKSFTIVNNSTAKYNISLNP